MTDDRYAKARAAADGIGYQAAVYCHAHNIGGEHGDSAASLASRMASDACRAYGESPLVVSAMKGRAATKARKHYHAMAQAARDAMDADSD